MRCAIVAVHGIGPAQRYALQNELGENLARRLPGRWVREAFFPPNAQDANALECHTAMRVRPAHRDASASFDIYEAYWSPTGKNKTSIVAVLRWLLNGLFAPLNSVTPPPATGAKLAFDLGFVVVAVALVAALPLVALAVLSLAYANASIDVSRAGEAPLAETLAALVSHSSILRDGWRPWVLVSLASGVAGWSVVGHVLMSFASARTPRKRPRKHFPWQNRMRILAVSCGAALLALSWFGLDATGDRDTFHLMPLLLFLAVIFGRLAFGLTHDFFVNRIGDIQIYTSNDSNARYFVYRHDIIRLVERTLLRVLRMTDGDRPYYDRIYVFGHSLGSTIAMDALIRLRQSLEAGDLADDEWRRIAALVTFGTALEKTRFFFGVGKTTLAESYEHWRSDLHARMFTADPSVLEFPMRGSHAIFWANYWYLRDIVANEIVTYQPPGEPSICYNVRLRERKPLFAHPWVHSDYLADPRFWTSVESPRRPYVGALDILTTPSLLKGHHGHLQLQ